MHCYLSNNSNESESHLPPYLKFFFLNLISFVFQLFNSYVVALRAG